MKFLKNNLSSKGWMLLALLSIICILLFNHALRYYLNMNSTGIQLVWFIAVGFFIKYQVSKFIKSSTKPVLKPTTDKKAVEPEPKAEKPDFEDKVMIPLVNIIAIPPKAISIQTSMKYINQSLRYMFYLYKVNGIFCVKTVKVEYRKDLKTQFVNRKHTNLPVIEGSIYDAVALYVEKKITKNVVANTISTEIVEKQTPIEVVKKVANEQFIKTKSLQPVTSQPVAASEKDAVDVTTGTVIDFGSKVFSFKGVPSKSPVFYCDVKLKSGIIDTIKGVALEDAFEKAKVKIGDFVSISKSNKPTTFKNGDGSVKNGSKNLFLVSVFS